MKKQSWDAALTAAAINRVESKPRRLRDHDALANFQTAGVSAREVGKLEGGLSQRLLRLERPLREWPLAPSRLWRDGRPRCPDVVPGDV